MKRAALLAVALAAAGCASSAEPTPDMTVRPMAIAWLQAQGLYDGLPVFDDDARNLEAYARAVEAHCGVPTGHALAANDRWMRLTLDIRPSVTEAQFSCVLNSVFATDFGQAPVSVHLMGEDAERP